MKNNIKIVCLIVATIVGAGFSSGREIYSFFINYKECINIIWLTTFLVFGLAIYYTLKFSYEFKISEYSKFMSSIYGNKMKQVIEVVMKIFLIIILSIMISGFGEFINSIFGIKKIYGSIFLVLICFITLLSNIEGIIKISVFIVPVIISSIIILFAFNNNVNLLIIDNNKNNYINYFSGILYASYNVIIATPVIVSSSKFINKNKDIKFISLLTTCIIALLLLLIYLIIDKYTYIVKDMSMPLLYIASLYGNVMQRIYIFVIGVAIYTTAVSTQYSLIQRYKKRKYIYSIIITSILSLLISFISFNKLIDICFPIIGLLGILQIIYVIFKSIRVK